MSCRLRFGPALIAITLLASPAPLLPGSPEGKEAPRASDPVASISFSDMAGAPHTLTEFQGKVVVLEFWAPWCIPCRRGVPFLDDLEAAHAAEGLKVVALTMETDEGSVRAFLEANPGKFLVGRDPTGRSAESLGVAAMPTTFLIDRSGRAVARYEGGTERSHEELRKGVEAILRDQPLEATTASRRSPAPKGALRPWERGLLADPIMNLDGAALEGTLSEHIHTSKEGASGNGGVAGGGCGCN